MKFFLSVLCACPVAQGRWYWGLERLEGAGGSNIGGQRAEKGWMRKTWDE